MRGNGVVMRLTVTQRDGGAKRGFVRWGKGDGKRWTVPIGNGFVSFSEEK